MPSDKKRVNLTIPDELYARIQAYKARSGAQNDATACLQLIVQQLNGLERTELLIKVLNTTSLETLTSLSNEGLAELKKQLELDADGPVPSLPTADKKNATGGGASPASGGKRRG